MAWIESHQTLGTHLKLMRLAKALGCGRPQAVGHLHYLWWWALDNAPSGCLERLLDDEIASVCLWDGNHEQFVAALRSCGWLDDGNCLHDWEDYAGRIVAARAAARVRVREYRERERMKRERNANETRTTQERSDLPYRTQPNSTKEREGQPSDTPGPNGHDLSLPADAEAANYYPPATLTPSGSQNAPLLPRSAAIGQLHATWERLTGQTMRLRPDTERLWYDWTRVGWSEVDLERVIRYLQAQIREGKRNAGALKLRNLLAPDRFPEDLALAGAVKPKTVPKPLTMPVEPPKPEMTAEQRAKVAELLKRTAAKVRVVGPSEIPHPLSSP